MERWGHRFRIVSALLLAALALPATGAERPGAAEAQATPSQREMQLALPAVKFGIEAEQHDRVLDVRDVPADQLHVLKADGLQTLSTGTREIRLQPGELVVQRLPQEAMRLKAKPGSEPSAVERWALPFKLVGVDAAGETFNLVPIVVDGGGLLPQSDGSFRGSILALLQDADDPQASRTLNPPVELAVSAKVDEVTPRQVSLTQTNHFAEISLGARNPVDPLKVRLVTSFDPAGTEIELPVLRGHLQLTVSPQRIQGLGLETARVGVQVTGVPAPEGLEVALSSDGGSLDAGKVLLDAGGVAETTIRSITVGDATVRATAANLQPAIAKVRFAAPWLFLAAAVLGGLAGALLRWGRTAPKARRKLWFELVLGVVVGLVATVAYSVGINLLGVEPTARAGEALVFALSAIAARFGFKMRSKDAA